MGSRQQPSAEPRRTFVVDSNGRTFERIMAPANAERLVVVIVITKELTCHG